MIKTGLSFKICSEINESPIFTRKVIKKKKAKPILNPSLGEFFVENVTKNQLERIVRVAKTKLKSSYCERIKKNAIFKNVAARVRSIVIFFICIN